MKLLEVGVLFVFFVGALIIPETSTKEDLEIDLKLAFKVNATTDIVTAFQCG